MGSQEMIHKILMLELVSIPGHCEPQSLSCGRQLLNYPGGIPNGHADLPPCHQPDHHFAI
jgi:hypothetical protein